MALKIFAAIMCAVSLLAMAAQLNDPDPLLWLVIYAVPAALGAAALFGRLYPRLTAAVIALYMAGFLYLSPALSEATLDSFASMTMRHAIDEESREAIGLLLSASMCAVLMLVGSKRTARKT